MGPEDAVPLVRVHHDKSGEYGFLNLQTGEVITDARFESLLRSARRPGGCVLGNPLETSEWISAEYALGEWL